MEGQISFWGYKEQESNLILPEHDHDDDDDNIKARTSVASDGPVLCVIEMCISAVHREIRMRQGASRSIERVTISVFSPFETNFDVNLSLSFLLENEICLICPNLERLGKLSVHFCILQIPWIFGDLVRQLLHSPPTACLNKTQNCYSLHSFTFFNKHIWSLSRK